MAKPYCGDWVRLTEVAPDWARRLPVESQQVIQACLGRTFRITGTDDKGQLVLDVGSSGHPFAVGHLATAVARLVLAGSRSD